MRVERDDPFRPDVRALLEEHLRSMHELSPPESVHALDVARLAGPDIAFWSVRDGETLLGCGALKALDAEHGEIKAMRTAPASRRRGAARAVLTRIIEEARARGYRRLSLETGSMEAFEAARTLYRSVGFTDCGPFAEYTHDPNSVLMTLALSSVAQRPRPAPQPAPTSEERSPEMSERNVRLHRVLRAKPEKVYKAFLDAEAMAKWLPPHGFTCAVQHFEPVAGGSFRMSFRNFSTGDAHAFGCEYIELVPHTRIRYTDRFDDPGLPGEMAVTVELREVSCGTELTIVQAGIPAMIPLEMCHLGWQESLLQLAALVEADIPG